MNPEQDKTRSESLDDSWFKWQKPITSRPPPKLSDGGPASKPASKREPIADEESIDEVADDWFR